MQFPSRFENERSESDRHRKILNGNYAIVGRIVGGVFFPENQVRDCDMKVRRNIFFPTLIPPNFINSTKIIEIQWLWITIKGYRLMRDSVSSFFSSFALQPWLIHSVDKVWNLSTFIIKLYFKRRKYKKKTKFPIRYCWGSRRLDWRFTICGTCFTDERQRRFKTF